MDERQLLGRLRKGQSEALGEAIEQYSAYVCAIARNIVDPPLQAEDVEEIASDVFIRLWQNAAQIEPGKLRPWLAAVTRNRARDRLRHLHLPEPLEEAELEFTLDDPENGLVRGELLRLTREAVERMPEPDRDIFLRHYYLYEKTDAIARELGMNPATVRTRLARGRERLRAYLNERGYSCEAVNC